MSEFTKEEPETSIQCLAPVEIAADKLSALCWRAIKRNRELENDDPTLVRHLHDLCALREVIERETTSFVKLVKNSFTIDQATSGRSTDASLIASIEKMIDILGKDEKYKDEYQRFVDAMSYADDHDTIDFELAVSTLKNLYSNNLHKLL